MIDVESEAGEDVLWNLELIEFVFLSLQLVDEVEHTPRIS